MLFQRARHVTTPEKAWYTIPKYNKYKVDISLWKTNTVK